MSEKISLAFMEIAKLAEALGVKEINKLDGCWECQVDEQWHVAVNGHPYVQQVQRDGAGWSIDPFHCYVEFNGWPAGSFHPHGGWIGAGGLANEEAFIEALQRATEKAKEVANV
jgi:hypothetical protein